MSHVSYLLLGTGNGAIYAAIAVAIVVVYRTSGVIHFAAGASAMYGAYTYALLTVKGKLFNPLSLPSTGSWLLLIAGLLGVVAVPLLRTRRITARSGLGAGAVIVAFLASRQAALIDVGTTPRSLALLVVLITSALVGLLSYLLIFRHLQNAVPLAKIVASVGLMSAMQSLCNQHFGDTTNVGAPIFPSTAFQIGGVAIEWDRILLAACVVAVGFALTMLYRHTAFGLRSLAVTESPRGAMLIGISPTSVGTASWLVSGALTGVFGALIAPLAPITPSSYTLFVLPALGAALVARFASIPVALAVGIGIGMAESELLNLAQRDWWPSVLTPSLLPFLVIVLVMIFRGTALPARGDLLRRSMPHAPEPRNILLWAVVLTIVVSVLLMTSTPRYTIAITMSLVAALFSLSLVVVSGYLGQISFAQMAFAGIAGFMMNPLTAQLGLPFPVAPIAAALVAVLAGLLLGLPALRVRGMDLAVLTLAMAVAIEQSFFSNSSVTGGMGGSTVDPPSLFGIPLGLAADGRYPRPHLGFVALAFVVLIAVAVAGLRRSRLGLQMLAVRSNERAASAAGIDLARTKLVGFAISAFIAGLGGALYAYVYSSGLSAASFGVFVNITLVSMAVLIGITSVTGGVLAGFASGAGVLGVFLHSSANLGSWYEFILALLLIVAAIQNPEGVVGLVQGKVARLRSKRAAAVSKTGTAPMDTEAVPVTSGAGRS